MSFLRTAEGHSGRCHLFQRLVALVPLGQFSLEMFLDKLESCLIFVVLFSALRHHKNSRAITHS